jgi:O-antigen biosynthesis protein
MNKSINAWLVDGSIYVTHQNSDGQAVPYAIKQGGLIHLLEATTLDTRSIIKQYPQTHNFLDHIKSRLTIVTKDSKARVLRSGINARPKWAPQEEDRILDIQLSNTNQEVVIEIVDSLELHASEAKPIKLDVLLACHRAEGELIVKCTQDGRNQNRVIKFDPGLKGGIHLESHLHSQTLFHINRGLAVFELKIRHLGFKEDYSSNHNHSHYFLARALLQECSEHETEKQGKSSQSPLDPRSTTSLKYPSSSTFLSCKVMPFTSCNSTPAYLIDSRMNEYELFKPLDLSLELVECFRHSLKINASTPGKYSLFINKKLETVINLTEGDNLVYIPRRWLRGEPILLEFRDASGSQIILSHPVLAPRHLTPEDVLLSETKPQFPTDLTCRANHRYQALRAHLQQPIEGISAPCLLHALETLDSNYKNVKLAPLSFPIREKPEVTVVIPAHNNIKTTYYALCALLLAHNKTMFEVIVVDDGSTDETSEIEGLIKGITVIRNHQPLRFIQACNKGVGAARSPYVVLLNNDTEVTIGWLDALVDAFQRFPGVGAVGSKLLYPDGTLQDAGGIVWRSGNPWNYGNKQNPWDPRFCYARQVDYLSGASLMTTKAIWDQVGGLSSYLEPMYFDDTDFSFKVREAGYKTYFVPSSLVYHFEGITSGTDTSSGFKKYQEVNRPKFKRRWVKAFALHGEDGVHPDLEKDRGISGRVLFIDYTTPREDRDAGSYAAIREIELVQSLGYKVTFLPQNLAFFGSYTEQLQKMGVEMITAPFYLSVESFLEERAREFDAAYITRYNVAADTVHLIRAHSPKTRIILNNADLHFLRELRASLSSNDNDRMQTMREIRDHELNMMRSVDLVLSYNDVEHAVISSHTDGDVKVMTCPWVVDIPETVAPLNERSGLSFLGSAKHHPNAEGLRWFWREVMPQLEHHEMQLTIYGSGMDDELKELASKLIHPVGYIEDVAEAYQRHRIFVAPLLSGAGVKGKVIHALAYGIPTVLTPTAAEGIGLRHGHDCLIAKKPKDWGEAITRLYHDNELWVSISQAARSYAASQFSFAAGKLTMKAALEAVDLFSHTEE